MSFRLITIGALLIATSGAIVARRYSIPCLIGSDRRLDAPAAIAKTELPGRASVAPHCITPHTIPLIPISLDTLNGIMAEMRPQASVALDMPYCLHLLRLHGLDAQFEHPKARSSAAIIDALTDDNLGTAFFGWPAIVRTRNGVRFPTAFGKMQDRFVSAERHRDHCLATLAELGLPVSHSIHIDGQLSSLWAALQDSVANFHLDQKELAWTALAYAIYLPPITQWSNRFGDQFSFDMLVREMMTRNPAAASCAGVHNLYSLTYLLRIDQQCVILSNPTRAQLQAYLLRAVSVAISSQRADGHWDLQWNEQLQAEGTPRGWTPDSDHTAQVLVTGHLLEWMLYLPRELLPHDDVLRCGGIWLRDQLISISADDKQRNICPCTHAVCALRQLALNEP